MNNIKIRSKTSVRLLLTAFGIVAGTTTATATSQYLQLSQDPLFSGTSAEPNVLVAVDERRLQLRLARLLVQQARVRVAHDRRVGRALRRVLRPLLELAAGERRVHRRDELHRVVVPASESKTSVLSSQ